MAYSMTSLGTGSGEKSRTLRRASACRYRRAASSTNCSFGILGRRYATNGGPCAVAIRVRLTQGGPGSLGQQCQVGDILRTKGGL